VPGERDADVLILPPVLRDEAGHLGEQLVAAAAGGEPGRGGVAVGGVEREEPGLDPHVRARIGRVEARG
jgi:hypothetical protein